MDYPAAIAELHGWYSANVLPMRQTPGIERLWFDFLKEGYTASDLRMVVAYLRREIAASKRNEGALKLSNLLGPTELGPLGRFAEDLGLARARKNNLLNPERRLAPAPGAPVPTGAPTSVSANPATRPKPVLADRDAEIAATIAEMRKAAS